MRTPFPGMDPYLENPESWQGFHNSLIAALALDLAPSLRPRYYVATEERTYLYAPDRSAFMGRPDLNVVGPTLQEPSATWSVASPTAGAVRVELPIPDHVREAFLEVRQAGSMKSSPFWSCSHRRTNSLARDAASTSRNVWPSLAR